MKTQMQDAFKFQYRMLQLSGAWPEENPTTLYKLKGFLAFLSVVALVITMLIDAMYHIADFAKLSEVLYIMITMTTYIFKHISLYLQREFFARIMKILKKPILSTYPGDLDHLVAQSVKFSTTLATVYQYMVFADVFLMVTAPIFNKQPLPFPFPYELGRCRLAMYALQVIGIVASAFNNPNIDSLTAALMGLAATHLEILKHKIHRITDAACTFSNPEGCLSVENDKAVVEELRNCVEHHHVIIDYVRCVDRVFSFGILMQFLGSVIIICNTLFHFLVVDKTLVKFLYLVNYLMIMLTELFLYCGFGHDIIWKSSQIGEACYTMNWYNCDNIIKKPLFIIMERSRRPLAITVFKFSVLSLSTFLTILQWSYSYFALLVKLYNKKK